VTELASRVNGVIVALIRTSTTLAPDDLSRVLSEPVHGHTLATAVETGGFPPFLGATGTGVVGWGPGLATGPGGQAQRVFVWQKRSGRRSSVRVLWWPLVLSLVASVLLTLFLNFGR